MDPIIRSYLDRSVEILLSADAESLLDEQAIDPIAYDCGSLSAVMRFPGGWRLSVHMRIELRGDRAILQRYSMHFMNEDDDTIFRYDNSPHFDEARLDHKHEGGDAFVCPQPSVRQIRNEIADYLIRGQPNG